MKRISIRSKRSFGLPAILTLCVSILFGHCTIDRTTTPPNILFIAVDDLKPMLNCYGHDQIVSPNIDEIAGNGAVFLRNYCQQAICGPSRASLMTGLRPDHTGVWDLKTRMRDVNPDLLTIPQYFRENGYTTAAFGKIYDPRCVDQEYDAVSWSFPYIDNNHLPLPDGIEAPMFGHYQDPDTRMRGEKLLREARELGLEGYDQIRYGLAQLKPVTEAADVPDNAYQDGVMTREAILMLEKMSAKEGPFFLAVGFKKPHLPFVAPRKYWELYDREQISTAHFQKHAVNGPDIAYHNSGEIRSYTGFEFKDGLIPENQQKEIIHGYYAAVSYIDALIGNIITKLKELDQEDNTIIVLWGDHGWHLGDHGMWCKHSNFEQATRSPLIISAPGMKKHLKVPSPSDFIDIFPTLCELASLDIPEHLEGTSLVPLLNGKAERVKDYSISQYPRGDKVMGYTMRTERYRYTEWHNSTYKSFDTYDPDRIVGRELYDYQKDTFETVNVFEDPGYVEIAQEMSRAMASFLRSQENLLPRHFAVESSAVSQRIDDR